MVGNGATNWSYDVWPSFPATLANFQIMPQSVLTSWYDNDCHAYFHNVRPATETPECEALAKQMFEYSGKLNWYDLYRHNYDLPLSEDRIGTTVIDGKERTYKRGMTMAEYTPFAAHILESESAHVRNGDFLTDYMNRQDVREAFHIPAEV